MDPPPTHTAALLTEGSLLRALHRLATPMLVGAVLSNLHSVINLFWVGRLGPNAVAAVAVGGAIMMLLFPALMGLSTGTVALVARAIGAGRRDEAAAAAGQSLTLALVLGLLSGLLGWHYSDACFRLLGAAPELLADGEAYLRVNLLGSFTLFLLIIASAALQGAGDTRTPMWVGLIANGLNIVLDPLLIYGLGPVPALGVRGAALASVIAQALAAVLAVGVLFDGRATLHISWPQCRPRLALAWRILRIGIPGSGQMLSRSLMGAVLMRIVAGCGTAAVAAYGTGLRFHMLILMPAFALGGAAATLVGQNLGAGKPGRARQAAWLATALDVVIMLAVSGLLAAFAPALIRAFNRDPDVVRIGASYLRIVSPFYVFAAFGVIIGRALNGAGDSLAPMIITILSLWGLQVPLALWLVRWWQPATTGVWWAIGLASAVNGLLMTLWFETGRWQRRQV
ncbi:MAG: MATE family efflux transporter [Kiritimatiellaeota bacterium]|nr:MATE family efflux transporter [Kiritimatiellota bacterium]